MNFKLPKTHFLLNSDQFQKVYKGKREENRSFIIYSDENDEKFSRIAIVVSRKFGKSVKRNRVRRQIKEYFRKNRCDNKNTDFIIIPKRERKIEIKLLSKIF
jgi:ribonuclease P protein component